MADVPTSADWAELRKRMPLAEDALATIPVTVQSIETPLAIAVDSGGYLHLLVPVTAGPVIAMPPDLKGLKIRHRILESGEFLDLIAAPSYEQVFNPVCRDIISAVVGEHRDPWLAVSSTIRAWQAAWRPVLPELDKNVQVGLFGELLVLKTLMIPCLGSAAIDQWSGPDSERHDFVSNYLHIEVKTTRKSRHEHEISRLDQLRVPRGCKLLLASIQLEQSVGGNQTLATIVDETIDLLRKDWGASDRFMTKLANIGWSETMRLSGELLRFFVRSTFIYAVDDFFPRLPDDFEPPSGVVSVKYAVDLANLPALDMDEVGAMIKAANSCGPVLGLGA